MQQVLWYQYSNEVENLTLLHQLSVQATLKITLKSYVQILFTISNKLHRYKYMETEFLECIYI